ncbi:LysR substrate-binding domain-containing protein [Pelagibius sp. Alg239-R121]|uniref:LysR substrate-binding domain-containing protein n=1 Tax=Pelagibius sp. Alg239-R121 TaxID=2993448 RepID=UPI0024A6DD45|nr:LysR substrate-binding domain-containing protein [Pelagibius sp. Alg239-R121]
MKNLNRINLGGLRAIEAVGRLGSLRAAAEELGVTPGAVSQQIQKTELQLGRDLFERRPKGLVLTTHGDSVLRHLSGGMAELSAAVALAERSREDSLTVSVAPVFASKWLVWRLKDFYKKHPGIRVRVDATVALIDPNLSDVDLCIRVGKGGWSDVKAEKLIDQRIFPVCCPALAEQIKSPDDLRHLPIIRDAGQVYSWNIWLAPNGRDESLLGDGPTFSDGSLCLDAAVAGQGVFLAWETLAADGLAMGRLVAPLPGRYSTGLSYWLVVGRHVQKSRSVKLFEAWLRSQLEISLQDQSSKA